MFFCLWLGNVDREAEKKRPQERSKNLTMVDLKVVAHHSFVFLCQNYQGLAFYTRITAKN